jgi:hypothetical protein
LLTHDLRFESWRSCCLGLHLIVPANSNNTKIHISQRSHCNTRHGFLSMLSSLSHRTSLSSPAGRPAHNSPASDLRIDMDLSGKPGPPVSTARSLRKVMPSTSDLHGRSIQANPGSCSTSKHIRSGQDVVASRARGVRVAGRRRNFNVAILGRRVRVALLSRLAAGNDWGQRQAGLKTR